MPDPSADHPSRLTDRVRLALARQRALTTQAGAIGKRPPPSSATTSSIAGRVPASDQPRTNRP